MKISREWLQKYFEKPLPETAVLADALTFHAFEIESIENDILDVKVTANRGHDCLSHRGIAKELSAILQLPMKNDPLRQDPQKGFTKPLLERGFVNPLRQSVDISVYVEEPALCPRFTGCSIKNIRVGPSPGWLRKHLESIGQKSINNIVDATNFVMFDMGQPLHAFDAGKLAHKNGRRSLMVRKAKSGERLVGLDDKEYVLDPSVLVIADAYAGSVASIAGIKGGKQTGVDTGTIDLFLEAANWDGVTIRRTSQALKLRTDASTRFEQVMSPEIAGFGIRAAADLIVEIAGGQIDGYIDEYPIAAEKKQVEASVAHINAILGSALSDADVAGALTRLDLAHVEQAGVFTVHVPFERLDLSPPAGGPEDIAEEVGRIIGYDKIPSVELSPLPTKPEVNQQFYTAEHEREKLISEGFSEVYTSVFADEGERLVLNKVDGLHPYLRTSLLPGLESALAKNILIDKRENVRLFEIGAVWKNGEEQMMIGKVLKRGPPPEERPLTIMDNTTDQYEDFPLSKTIRYEAFSKYPFIVRDISLWVPQGTNADNVLEIIRANAGELLVRSEKFDEFTKGEKVSMAFRLVFQSFDRTLTDLDANERMESVYAALKKKGWEIR